MSTRDEGVPAPVIDTFTIVMAWVGQAWAQAGASPAPRRWWHMSHFRTMPSRSLYFGTS